MYNRSDDGIQAISDRAINMIQKSAETNSDVTLFEVMGFVENLKQAPEIWLNNTWKETNIDACSKDLIDEWSSTDDPCDPSNNSSLLSYQFGDHCEDRLEWMAYLHCTGGKGCSFFFSAIHLQAHLTSFTIIFVLSHLWMRRKYF